MKKSMYQMILPVLALMICSAAASVAQTEYRADGGGQKATSPPNKKGQKYVDQESLKLKAELLKNEPHFVMAMAYLQNVATFARALNEQASGDSQLSSDFARAAVVEINRSLDKAKEHHQEHLQTMSPDVRLRSAVRIKEMDLRQAGLSNAVAALEKDVKNYTLDPKRIAADTATILQHLDELTKLPEGK